MTLKEQIAKHFSDVFIGGNWTSVNLRDTLADINWEEATTRVFDLNTIATLVFHMNYYVENVLKVLKGATLNASDKLSFNVPAINNEIDWQKLVDKTFVDAKLFAEEIKSMEEDKFFKIFIDPKYGDYYRNLHGIVEHTHYHLGQIVLLKKILRQKNIKEEE